MRKMMFRIAPAALALLTGCTGAAQGPQAGSSQAIAPATGEAPYVRRTEVGGRLPATDQQYGAIEGARLKGYVDELTAIARRYRDNGHPQFWGRIIGTEADAETAQWMLKKFQALGMTDVREQAIELTPQWMPRAWSVAAAAGGKTLELPTAQPTYLAVGTPAEGLDLEAVYVGMASDADLALARDVRGKAAFFYSTDLTSRHVGIADEAIRRIGERGAAAIFVIQGIPGNLRTQFYPVQSKVPTFTLGQRDGLAIRDLIGAHAKGPAPRVRVRLDVQTTPNLKTATAWGSLKGTGDETIFVVAHRDGWFDGANDNATGVATLVGIAEYFAKRPASQRRRTITFLGTSGHHNSGPNSGLWFSEHPEVFAKAALLINCEHTGSVQTGHFNLRSVSAPGASSWYASGKRLAGIVMNALDTFGVPTYAESSARPGGEIGRYFQFAPSVQVMSSAYVWHSDQETSESISTTGLEAVTRAYAKIIANVDSADLNELRELQNKTQ
jgi:hypothetical protein